MLVEFKEKTFESYFVSELSRKSKSFYCPDQTDEFHLGFDAMFFVHPWWNLCLPKGIGFAGLLKGITASDVHSMGSGFNRAYPNLKANLFFQFKRPDLLTTQKAAEWKHWSCSYFRFSLYRHQHDVLTQLSRCSSNKAKVLYAAPKLARTADLIDAAKHKKVVKSTQLVEASQLTGHKKCTYSAKSNVTLGHSEPKEIEKFEILEFLEVAASFDGENFTQATIRVGSEIKKSLLGRKDFEHILDLSRSIASEGWTEDMPQEFRDTWLDHLITIHAFSRAFGITTCLLS